MGCCAFFEFLNLTFHSSVMCDSNLKSRFMHAKYIFSNMYDFSSLNPELNFRSRILKLQLRLQKPRSFEASVGYIVINFHHFPLHFPCDSSENYLFSIFVLFLPYKKVTKTKKLLLRKIVKMMRNIMMKMVRKMKKK